MLFEIPELGERELAVLADIEDMAEKRQKEPEMGVSVDAKTTTETFKIGPITDSLRNLKPLGFYAVIKKRRGIWPFKRKTLIFKTFKETP